jgi:hypothetical protein
MQGMERLQGTIQQHFYHPLRTNLYVGNFVLRVSPGVSLPRHHQQHQFNHHDGRASSCSPAS